MARKIRDEDMDFLSEGESKLVESKSIKVKVLSIVKNHLIVEDEKGNHYDLPLSKENKDVKIGDTIYI